MEPRIDHQGLGGDLPPLGSPADRFEEAKCERAERMIRDAVFADAWLRDRVARVFAKGSYANNTNARLESDVDVGIEAKCFFYESDPAGYPNFDAGTEGFISPCPFSFAEFKDHVGAALVAKFGATGVSRGDKSFDIHETSARIDADAVPSFGYRYYWNDHSAPLVGTQFVSDSGKWIENYPDQQLANGNAKNRATGLRFKYITRVIKRLRNKMADEKVVAAIPIPSYLIECLTWNVPNEYFGHNEYWRDVRESLAHTFNATLMPDTCKDWLEVNNVKYLFHANQPWSREQAHAFLSAAWDYVGFE